MALIQCQPIASYHEDRFRSSRSSSLEEIRERRRADIYLKSIRKRAYKMMEKRAALLKEANTDDFFLDSRLYDNFYSNNDDPECQSTSAWGESTDRHSDDTLTPEEPWSQQSDCDDMMQEFDWTITPEDGSQEQSCFWSPPSPAPSPLNTPDNWSSSCSTVSSSSSPYEDTTSVPSFLVEPSTSSTPLTSQKVTRPKSLPFADRRENFKLPNSNSPMTPKATLDTHKVDGAFKALQSSLVELSRLSDSDRICHLLTSHHTVLTNVFQFGTVDTMKDVVMLLTTLVSENLVTPETMCHIIQNGFLFSSKNFILNAVSGTEPIVELLSLITRSMPAVVPYMIDMSYHSRLLASFEGVIDGSGSTREILGVLTWYYHVSELLISQALNTSTQSIPLLPDIVLKTTSPTSYKSVLESYSPLTSLAKILTPVVIKHLIKTCLARSFHRQEEMVTMALMVLANTLKMAHIKSLTPSAVSPFDHQAQSEDGMLLMRIVCAFRDSDLESKLSVLIEAYERLERKCETNERYSQGIGADDMASRSRDRCQQFLSFYHQYYGPLFATLQSKLTTCCCEPSPNHWI